MVVVSDSQSSNRGYMSLKNLKDNPFPLKSLNKLNNNPRKIGNVRAYFYVNHNPLFTIGPDCTPLIKTRVILCGIANEFNVFIHYALGFWFGILRAYT